MQCLRVCCHLALVILRIEIRKTMAAPLKVNSSSEQGQKSTREELLRLVCRIQVK